MGNAERCDAHDGPMRIFSRRGSRLCFVGSLIPSIKPDKPDTLTRQQERFNVGFGESIVGFRIQNPTTRNPLLMLNTVGIVGFVGFCEERRVASNKEQSAHLLRPLRCKLCSEVLTFGRSRKPPEWSFSLQILVGTLSSEATGRSVFQPCDG